MYVIRRAEHRDRKAILDTAAGVGVFTAEEVACVDELFSASLHPTGEEDYAFIVCCTENAPPAAFACYGPHPLTEGTYDLYWLCVSARAQGNGIAAALLDQVEKDLSALGARLLVAETSSTPAYAAARAFYEHHGFLRWT
jgi:ribosomal protein S18 acetylase RimI-like enzyme